MKDFNDVLVDKNELDDTHPLKRKMDEVFDSQKTINELYEDWLLAIQMGTLSIEISFPSYLKHAKKMLFERLGELKTLMANDGRIVNNLLSLIESGEYIPTEGRGKRVPREVLEFQDMLIRKTIEVIELCEIGELEPCSK